MKFKKILTCFITFFVLFATMQTASAQEIEKDEKAVKKKKQKFDSSPAIIFSPNYAGQIPFGGVAQRFGFNSLFSAQIMYKTVSNWLIAAEGGFLFGTDVKQSYVINNIATSTGQCITQNNDLTTLFPVEEGFNLKFEFGKVIPVAKRYPDAGIMLLTGVGFLEHKIAINAPSDVPQFSGPYKKGYDRLTSGPVFSQFVGYEFCKRRGLLNGYIGMQFDIAYTENRRPYDFYLMEPLHTKETDMFLSFKVGWIIPKFFLASGTEREIFYY